MSIDGAALVSAISSKCSQLGVFDSVTTHEPKASPGRTGTSASVWITSYEPIQSSGMASASMRIEVMVRIYTSMLQEPADEIDTSILTACDALMSVLIGDFDLGVPGVRHIDVFGQEGERLRAVFGYLSQDGKLFRVMDVFVPILVNDVYTETA